MDLRSIVIIVLTQMTLLHAADRDTETLVATHVPDVAPTDSEPDNSVETTTYAALPRIRALNRLAVATHAIAHHAVLRHHQEDETQNAEHDTNIHARYHLPLQRLTDAQLSLLLRKLTTKNGDKLLDNDLDRAEMISRIQHIIVEQGAGLLMRPKMLIAVHDVPTQLNGSDIMLPDTMSQTRTTLKVPDMAPQDDFDLQFPQTSTDSTTDIEAVTHESLTEASTLPQDLPATSAPFEGPSTADTLTTTVTVNAADSHSALVQTMMETLRKLKLQYESVRQEFLRRLRQINERRVTLAHNTLPLAKEHNERHQTTSSTIDSSDVQTTDDVAMSTTTVSSLYEASTTETTLTSTNASDDGTTAEAQPSNEASVSTKESLEYISEAGTRIRTTITRKSSRLDAYSAQANSSESIKKTSATIEADEEQKEEIAPQNTANDIASTTRNIEEVPTPNVVPRANAVPTVTLQETEQDDNTMGSSETRSEGMTATELVERLQSEMQQNSTDASSSISSAEAIEKSVEDKLNDEAVCNAIRCDFENGDLCEWDASVDELSPTSRHYFLRRWMHRSRRMRRSDSSSRFVLRTWHNWQGQYRNHVTGIARAKIFSESNQRFAAAYVRPMQRATLTGQLFSGEPETIRFRAWEATRNVQLRVCCGTTENCVFATELGVKRGSRRWNQHSVTCEKGTKKVIFECVNHGIFQGACGVDNIELLSSVCTGASPFSVLHDGGRRLLH